jgi:hypothetical protein
MSKPIVLTGGDLWEYTIHKADWHPNDQRWLEKTLGKDRIMVGLSYNFHPGYIFFRHYESPGDDVSWVLEKLVAYFGVQIHAQRLGRGATVII